MNINATTAKADENFISKQIKDGKAKTKKRLSGKVKSVSEASDEMLNELADELKKQANVTVSVYSFDQYFGNTLIDNTAINVTNRMRVQLFLCMENSITKLKRPINKH